jgi:hypothetical protein
MRDAARMPYLRRPLKDSVRSAHCGRFGDERQPQTKVGTGKELGPYRRKLDRRLKEKSLIIIAFRVKENSYTDFPYTDELL